MSVLFWILINENIVYIGSQAIGRGLKQWPLMGCSDSILLELAWFHIKAMQSPEFALGCANWGVRVENGFMIPNSWTYEHKNKTMVKFAQKKARQTFPSCLNTHLDVTFQKQGPRFILGSGTFGPPSPCFLDWAPRQESFTCVCLS